MSIVQIAWESLDFKPAEGKIIEPLTGATVAKLAGIDDPNQVIVIQWLSNGSLESLRPDEKAQVESELDLRFVLFYGASIYLFEIDERRFKWGAPRISGAVLKELAGVVPDKFGVWQQKEKGDDERIDNDKFADLSDQGLEKFYTARMESTEGVL